MTDPDTVEIERTLSADRVGPAMWGEIYRSRHTGTYLRVIPNGTRGLTVQRRHELDGWPLTPPADGLAPVVGAGQRGLLRDRWFHCVEYRVDGEPLADVLARSSAADRAAVAARVLRALPAWWRALGAGLLPMVGDIVLMDGEPCLLRVPPWGVPGPAALLAEPSRALHLAPELVRGEAVTPDRAADLFAVGSALLGFAFEPDAGHAATVLQRIAAGTARDPAHRTERLPAWTARVPAVAHGISSLIRLVSADRDERAATELDDLADELADCAEALDPVAAVLRLHAEEDDPAALLLAQEALLDDASYDLYLLAAGLAANRLGRPLSALTFLDEAVRSDPSRPEAYAAQFRLVARVHDPVIAALSRIYGPSAQRADPIIDSFIERLDRIMTEAFEHFDADERDRQLPEMADYLVARGRRREASERLHEALVVNGKEHWWKFGHMLAFGRAILAGGQCPQARTIATRIRSDLVKVEKNRSVPEADIARYRHELREFEHSIRGRCGDGR